MTEKNDALVFQPIRGLEENINKLPKHDGFVYFAYDSGNIYLDKEDMRFLMGSSSAGFFWSNGNDSNIIKIDLNNPEDPSYYIFLSALEENIIPKENGLILNSDGRFFRVKKVLLSDNKILADLIAVSGTGGSGDTPSTKVDLELTWQGIDQLGSTYVFGKENEIIFRPNSLVDDVCSLSVVVTDGATDAEITKYSATVRNGNRYIINTKDFPVNNNIVITATVISANSTYNGSRGLVKIFKPIQVLNMQIVKPQDNTFIGIQNGSGRLSYLPYFTGLGTAKNPVRLYYSVDQGASVLGATLVSGNDQNKQYIEIPHQQHGMHIIALWLSVIINNKEETSAPIYYEVPFVDSNNEDHIIWTQGDLGTITQYEPAVVKYMVYSPVASATGGNIEVQFLQNGVLFDSAEVTYNGTRWHTLDLTSKYNVGENHFSIVSNGAHKDVDFIVTSEGARNLDLVHATELEMNFDSMGRSNKQIKANRISFISDVEKSNGEHKVYPAILNNFNWYNNGWLDDNDGNGSYLSVTNGASVTIPTKNIGINAEAEPWTFEIRFRIRNAKKFATLVTEIPIYQWTKPDGSVSQTGEELTLEEIATKGGTPLRDSDGNLVMNEANTTRKEVRTDKYIAFKFLNDDNYGFAIGTQEAYFNVRGKVVNVKYSEGEIINISFVENKAKNQLSIYLNGILSGVGNLSGTTAFSMAGKSFEINSEYCDFDLYKFRAYPLALSMPEIIHNYLSDMKNIDLYDENQLADINDATKLSYSRLLAYNKDHKKTPTMPYVVIDMTGKTSSGQTELPYAKTASGIDGARIEFTNPTADYLLEQKEITAWDYYTHCPSYTANNVNINVQGTSSQIYPRRNFKTKFKKAKQWIYTFGPLKDCPVNYSYYFNEDGTLAADLLTETVAIQDEIAEIDAIKTPTADQKSRKKTLKANLKSLGTGKKVLSKNWHEDSEAFGTNKFTWKIDYMESSGSYNTGFANLMGNKVYYQTKTSQVHHPLDDLGFDGSEYRTTVYGFPMLAFHKTAEDTYTYIGRYNCNLDKSANERYGFELEKEHPYVTNQDGTHPLVADIAECWELRDNQGLWCSFRYPQDARELQFATPKSETNPGVEVAQHFEVRYHAFADEFEYAQNIILDKENSEDYSEAIGGTDKEVANLYVLDKLKNLKILFDWLDSTDPINVTNKPLIEVIGQESVTLKVNGVLSSEEQENQGVEYFYDNSVSPSIRMGTFTKDSAEYRRQKFYSEFNEHLDLHYCSVYFVMTELLLCYDSRGKNMMMATFGPTREGGDYIWYPIFYDIDTQLGLNNVGAQLWGYDEDCTENNTFSTAQSVLWMNFNDMFKENIKTTYRTLRGGGEDGILSYKNIEGAYICDPEVFKQSYAMRGRRPILAMGLDEYYKYVLPITEEWRNQEGKLTTANYLYACQGDRKLSRELLINNRLLYMDSKWAAGSFTINTGGMAGIMFRSTGNKRNTTSDKYIDVVDNEGLVPFESTITRTIKDSETGAETEYEFIYAPYKTGIAKYYDADPEYKITPYLNFYLTTFIDEIPFQNTSAYDEEKYPDGMPVYVNPSVKEGYRLGNVDQQLNYFAGSSYITSIGDISTKYVNQVNIPNTPRLTEIILGSDAPDYFYNDKLDPFNLCTSVNDETGLPDKDSDKPLLTKIILTNIKSLTKPSRDILDVRSPGKLQEFRALGTFLSSVLFAEGAPLKIVHLPNTMERIVFIQNKDLTKILTSPPVVADMIDDELVYRDPKTYEGLYIAGVTDYQDSETNRGQGSPVNEIDIEGDAMGYDSYRILQNVVLQKYGSGRGNRLSIKMIDVNWTPYIQVEYGEKKLEDTNYFWLTDHSTYEPYNHEDDEWDNDTLNGRVYTFNESAPKSTISDLSLLQIFLNDYLDDSTPVNQFTNNISTEVSNKTYPALSGQLFVANADAEHGISETELSEVYAKAWPNLMIRAEKIETSYLTKYIEIDPNSGKEIILDDKAFSDDDTITLAPASRLKKPMRTHYDFRGFGIRKQNDENDLPDLYVIRNENDDGWELTELGQSLQIDPISKTLKLYAIFTPTIYKIRYYHMDDTLIEEVDSPYSNLKGSIKEPTVPPYRNEDQLELYQSYVFLGYAEKNASHQFDDMLPYEIPLVNMSQRVCNKNMDFYAIFDEKSVTEIDYTDYFEAYATNMKYTDKEDPIYNYNTANGVVLTFVPPSVKVLQGKVMIPSTWDGKPVIGLYNLANQNLISHIFFEKDNQIKYISTKCCYQMTNLRYFDFVNLPSLREIQKEAFALISNLSLVDSIGDSSNSVLNSIGESAFKTSFSSTSRPNSLNLIRIPGSIKYFGKECFSYQEFNQGTVSLQIGDENNLSQLTIDGNTPPVDNEGLFGANRFYAWDNIDFYTANYSGNDSIYDDKSNEVGKLIDYFGILRDSAQALPNYFRIHTANTIVEVVKDGIYQNLG